MASVKCSYADGPFGQVHFRDTGGNGIPLLLCPQAPATSRQFDRIYERLGRSGIRAIGIDTPGFGMSCAPTEPPSIADYASVIPAILDHLNLDTAHLCGHHTGAMVVTEAAVAYAGRVSSLTLAGPVPLSIEERQQYVDTILEEEKSFAPKDDGSHLSELYVKRLAWIEDEPDKLALCTRYVVETLVGNAPFWYGHNAAFNYDHAESMRRVTQPTLILINTGDMLYEHAQTTMKMCPHFSYAEIQGGGIDITDQNPQAWAEQLSSYLHSLSDRTR